MVNLRNRFPARRRFLKQSAALTASASLATSVLAIAQPGRAKAGSPAQPAATPARAAQPAGAAVPVAAAATAGLAEAPAPLAESARTSAAGFAAGPSARRAPPRRPGLG